MDGFEQRMIFDIATDGGGLCLIGMRIPTVLHSWPILLPIVTVNFYCIVSLSLFLFMNKSAV